MLEGSSGELYFSGKDQQEQKVQPTESSESRVEMLRQAVDFLKKDVDRLLEERFDCQSQKDHLNAVLRNSSEILSDLYGRRLTEEEILKIKLFEYGHDRGKWDQKRAEEIMSSDKWEQVAQTLGLSSAERSILEKAKNGSPALKDLAHHMYSAILWVTDCMDENKLGALPEEVKEEVKTAILEHHFEGYYKGVAERNGFSDEEIAAVVRKPGSSEFSQACHDGDQLSMVQVGFFQDRKFNLGGYAKIVLISANLGLQGMSEIQGLEDVFKSPDMSVEKVRKELVTDKGKKLYEQFASETQNLKVGILADPEFSALKTVFKSGLDPESQKLLVRQLEFALRKHGKIIAQRRMTK
ncbi:MAG: hypothetical protein N2558_01800 [Patescibacteria group bacterium]|nr:hypothetical protein [Patescibacteria group bacterium]